MGAGETMCSSSRSPAAAAGWLRMPHAGPHRPGALSARRQSGLQNVLLWRGTVPVQSAAVRWPQAQAMPAAPMAGLGR